MELNIIHNTDCMQFMSNLDDNCIDLSLTSPPYNTGGNSFTVGDFYKDYKDNLNENEYQNFIYGVVNELLRITKHYVVFNFQILSGNKNVYLQFFSDYKNNIKDIAIWNKQAVAQKAIIRKHLFSGRHISQAEAASLYHIYCLAERIRDLREDGLVIADIPCLIKNSKGNNVRFVKYSLPKYVDHQQWISDIIYRCVKELYPENPYLNTRKRGIVETRQVVMKCLKLFTKMSLSEIAVKFGKKSHGTVLHAIDVVDNLCSTDPVFQANFDRVITTIKNQLEL